MVKEENLSRSANRGASDSSEAGSRHNPAFVVGASRSGTTLLVNMLGAHPLVAPIYETRFLRNLLVFCERLCWIHGTSWSRRCARVVAEPWLRSFLAKESARYRSKTIKYNALPKPPAQRVQRPFPFGNGRCIRYEMAELVHETDKWLQRVSEERLDSDDVYRTARDYVDSLFMIHCARMGKSYWINKTPGLLSYLDLLPRLYPALRCIHIIRDGRDVVVSNRSLGWGPKDIRGAARRWKSLIQKGRSDARSPRLGYMEVLYENLVASPRETMRRLGNFLALDGDSNGMADSIELSQHRGGAWRRTWSASQRREFAREAGDLLIELGYEKNDDWITH
jgi:hypothetical protein